MLHNPFACFTVLLFYHCLIKDRSRAVIRLQLRPPLELIHAVLSETWLQCSV